jgi:uncharacterized coiled-coil protein SlyX
MLSLPGIRNELIQVLERLRVPEVLKTLGRMDQRLVAVERNTDTLPSIESHLASVDESTATLPDVLGEMHRMSAGVEEMRDAMVTIAELVPVLVELQATLVDLPVTLSVLQTEMRSLQTTVTELTEAVEPMGRVAARMPRRRRGAVAPVDDATG